MATTTEVVAPSTIAEVREAVTDLPRLLPRGGGSKTGLSTPAAGESILDLANLSGIQEYEPGEFTFTALAGTPVENVRAALAEHGQYLPFDPPLAMAGATLGGTVAAGLSGSGRQRYGGVRDFLLGVRFVDGLGRLIRGGGKVVKNAAGFDLPKLMVGSLGALGVLVELSFKVFPEPKTYATLTVTYDTTTPAIAGLGRFTTANFDLEALDLICADGQAPVLQVRLGGLPSVVPERISRLRAWLGAGEPIDAADERAIWQAVRGFRWLPAGRSLVKVPLTLDRVAPLEAALVARGAVRRYIAGGTQAWIGWPGDLGSLERVLTQLRLSGIVVLGAGGRVFLGDYAGVVLARRVQQVLDPAGRFRPL